MNLYRKGKPYIIKGSLLSINKLIFWNCFAILLLIYVLYRFLFVDFLRTDEKELGLSILGLLGFLAFTHYLLSDEYYYYEFTKKTFVVKSRLKKFRREFYYDRIVLVNVYGYLWMSGFKDNSIEIVYLETPRKSHIFHSYNLSREDWINLIRAFQELGIKCCDPSKTFFIATDYKLDGKQ